MNEMFKGEIQECLCPKVGGWQHPVASGICEAAPQIMSVTQYIYNQPKWFPRKVVGC